MNGSFWIGVLVGWMVFAPLSIFALAFVGVASRRKPKAPQGIPVKDADGNVIGHATEMQLGGKPFALEGRAPWFSISKDQPITEAEVEAFKRLLNGDGGTERA